MKVITQVFFYSVLTIAAMELLWMNSSSDQRARWLEPFVINAVVQQIETDQPSLLLPQLLNAMVATRQRHEQDISLVVADQVQTQTDKLMSAFNRAGPDMLAPFIHSGPECIQPPTQEITEVKQQQIYRWTDASGRVHFGDKTQSNQAENMTTAYGRQTQGIKLNIDFKNWDGEPRLAADLQKESALMYRILTHYIPRQYWRQINLNLVIFPSQQQFENYKVKQQANPGWVAYYDGRRNQAYMAIQPDHDLTMRIARHEMTHAMMLGMLGSTPIWISEGIAQYLERLDWQMSAAKVAADRDIFTRLAHSGSHVFAHVASLDHYQFNSDDQQNNYHRASAMVHFLLGHQDGQQWLREVFGYFAQTPCGDYDAHQFFNQSYPGGISAAGENYRLWLDNQSFRTHYY